jgi:hypothetical protein
VTEVQRRYRVPTVSRYVDISLSDFDLDEIREYLRRMDRGEMDKPEGSISPAGFGEPLLIESDDLDRIATLALCGQKQHAQQYVLGLVSEHIGRDIT